MKRNVGLVLVLGSLVLLPACKPLEWIKDKLGFGKEKQVVMPDGSVAQNDVLVTMDGAPVISVADLNRDFEQLLAENPQLRQVLPMMPDATFNFLQGMVSQAVVDRYVAENHIKDKAEYKEERQRLTQSIERMLNTKYFNMEHPIEVADADVTKFYEDNKKVMPELMIERGGVRAVGVSFNREEDARAFAVRAKGQDAAKVAKASGHADKVHDFKYVNAQSAGIDKAVHNRILAMTKVPAVEVTRGEDKAFWVVQATERREPKYRELDQQVRDGIKQYMQKEKQVAMLDKEIAQLKEKYHVVVNEDYFKQKQQAAQQAAAQERSPESVVPAEVAQPAAKAA